MNSKGQLQALLLFVFLIVVLGIVFFVQPVVGPSANLAAASDKVAVLVIDAYEPLQDSDLDWTKIEGKNCVVTPDGQGGLISKAGGLISKAGGLISKAGGLISKATGLEILQPHGRIVYNEMEGLLRNQGAQLQQVVPGTQQFSVDWIRDVGQWQLPEGNIVLVAVDTNDYATDAITTRIQQTIAMLDQDMGISKFVLNMSFAIVPCDDVENTEKAYQEMLGSDFPGFEKLFDDLVNQGIDPATAIITAANTKDTNGALVYPDFFKQVAAKQPDVMKSVFSNCYPAFTGDELKDGANNGNGGTVDRPPADLATATLTPDLSAAQTASKATPTLTPTTGAEQTAEATVESRQQGNNNQAIPKICVDTQDPLAGELTALNGLGLQSGRTAQVISIASAGNRGDHYSFAPGYWDSVLSVSADYSGPENCPADQNLLQSNWGEVRTYGVTNCIPGTSFAAPRASAEAALYLLRGGSTSCSGSIGNSSPPMAHSGFDNLTRQDASDAYCQDFNALLNITLPTFVPTATP
ncbi:MAG: hypothetical protein ABI690_09405 [Chloroflexota bacterium]